MIELKSVASGIRFWVTGHGAFASLDPRRPLATPKQNVRAAGDWQRNKKQSQIRWPLVRLENSIPLAIGRLGQGIFNVYLVKTMHFILSYHVYLHVFTMHFYSGCRAQTKTKRLVCKMSREPLHLGRVRPFIALSTL